MQNKTERKNTERIAVVPEYLEIIDDLITHPKVLSMSNYIQHSDCTTLDHCICVSYFSYLSAIKAGGNERACARGGLLHDMYLYDWHCTKPPRGGLHGFVHPLIAAETAAGIFDLTELEKEIILVHMWPLTLRPPMSKEALIVSMTDKYCAAAEIFRLDNEKRMTVAETVIAYAKEHADLQ